MGRVDVVVRREEGFERLYAIKRLHAHLEDDEAFVRMFLDEARVGGLIRHANVVGVLDVGRDDDGAYFVMEYVEGESASVLCKHARADELRLPVQIAVRIAKQAAEGLHAAHELCSPDGEPLQLVHRDVSPQNLLVGHDGVVRLTDFGIAKALGSSTKTATGLLKGKHGYMSPEQLRFEPLDRRSDIFALGVVLYELLSSSRLYAGGEKSWAAVLNGAEPDIGQVRSDVPPELSQLLFTMLAKNRDLRPATARDVARALDEVLALLVSEEGVISLADFMEDRFGRERRTRVVEIREQLDRLQPLQGLQPLQSASQPNHARRAWLWGMMGGVALTIAAVAFAIANSDAPDAQTASPQEHEVVAPAVEATEAVAAVAEPSGTNQETVEAAELTEPDRTEPPELTGTMTRRSKMRRRRRAPASMKLGDVWQWRDPS